MDVPPTPPTPTPQTPYRAGKPLAEIIPPDRRRLRAAVLVVSSMIAGVALWEVGGFVLATIEGDRIMSVKPQPVPYVPGQGDHRERPVQVRARVVAMSP